jgi:hypothetical protein
MTVRMENIDELRRRTNVSYEAAKDALERCNDDLLEAIVYLEKQSLVRPAAVCNDKESFLDKIKKLIRKGNTTKFIVHKKEVSVVSIPVTLAVIIGIAATEITLIAVLLALVTGHRVKFEGKAMDCTKANEMMNKFADGVDCAKRKLTEDNNSEVKTN